MKKFFFYEDANFFLDFTKFLRARKQTNAAVIESVSEIVDDVKLNKDSALIKYTKKFDNINLESNELFYKSVEIEKSVDNCNLQDREAIDLSISRIWKFHKKQMPANLSWKDELGIELGWVWKPIERVGVYVPGGKASYPSSAIVNIVPAKVAGVDDIILASPSPNGDFNPLMLY